MQVFLAHATEDKELVESIGSWLHSEKKLEVWIDKWRLTAGDSLIEKIGEGIEKSDRLIVFLSPHSVESKWVKKEVATGLVLELAEEKGLGDKFVIPALLKDCKIPIMLRDKIYANFTDKSFEAAREELFRGITDQPLGPQEKEFENKFSNVTNVPPLGNGKYGLKIEFGVKISPIDGADIRLKLNNNYTDVKEWFGRPNQNTWPPNFGAFMMALQGENKTPPIFAKKFSEPTITSTKSYYVYLESDEPLQVIDSYYRENI